MTPTAQLAPPPLTAAPAVAPLGASATAPSAVLPEVRCACRRCGAHTMGMRAGRTLGGCCQNCGGYDLVPVDEPLMLRRAA